MPGCLDAPVTLDIIFDIEVTVMIIKIFITTIHIFVGNSHPFIVKFKIVGYYMVYIVFPVFICIIEIIFTISKSINATDSVFYVFSIVYAGIQFGAFINFFITQMGLLKKMRSRRQLKKVFDDLK